MAMSRTAIGVAMHVVRAEVEVEAAVTIAALVIAEAVTATVEKTRDNLHDYE
jgi:hypothetical protein